jgi:hypothetical protein
MTTQEWRTLAKFGPLESSALIKELVDAVSGLALPEYFLKRLEVAVSNAVQAARQRTGNAEVQVRLLVSQAYASGDRPHCWGFFRLERAVEEPFQQTEIEMFLFPEV